MECFSRDKSLKGSEKSWKCWKRKSSNKSEMKKGKKNARELAKIFKKKKEHGSILAEKSSLKEEISLSRNKHTSEVPLIRKQKGKNSFCCFGKSRIAESSEDVLDVDEHAKSAKSRFTFFRRSKKKGSSLKEKPLNNNCGNKIIESADCFCCFGSRNMKSSKEIFCWRWKKEEKMDNLTSLVKIMSFKSDSVKHRGAAEEILRIGNGTLTARAYAFRDLASATDNFALQNLLGKGGFGQVYKGVFEDTNQVIAVKKLDRNGYQGNREFLIEVLMLSVLNHPNLIKLLGYCADGGERILVYEFMKHGSLQEHLFDLPPNAKPLDWNTRMKIAAGAARGLEYLHDTADPPVIYRDLKVSNILLDEYYNPILADFGLAKIGPTGPKNHVSTRVMGTFGYCAPEYALTGRLTKMSDIYSFGVLLLELITGRKAMDLSRPRKQQRLVDWAAPRFQDRENFIELADPGLRGNFPVRGLYQALAVAAMCLQEEETNRPLIKDVVFALQFLTMPENSTAEVKCDVDSKAGGNDGRDVNDESMHSFHSFSDVEVND